jgi:hypothetical protein
LLAIKRTLIREFRSAPDAIIKPPYLRGFYYGGEGEIRTLGGLATSPHFECGALVHYATSPGSNFHLPGALLRRYLRSVPHRISYTFPVRCSHLLELHPAICKLMLNSEKTKAPKCLRFIVKSVLDRFRQIELYRF